MIDAATQVWVAVSGCPASALIGRYQLRQSDREGHGYTNLQADLCRIVDTHRDFRFDDVTREVFPPLDEVTLPVGVEAVRLLNDGRSMPLDIDWVREDVLADQEDL